MQNLLLLQGLSIFSIEKREPRLVLQDIRRNGRIDGRNPILFVHFGFCAHYQFTGLASFVCSHDTKCVFLALC